ncbi:MAG TPA: TRIC cation channel family protein [Thermomicrobiales bacterium]|nr:TRIC cation channel family protein [Thermomicrobiales bacterium]
MNIAVALDLVGTLVFALSGALVGVRRDLDLFGIAVLAVSAGTGGWVLRYLPVALVAAGIGFFYHPGIAKLSSSVRLLDAVGLGFFAIAGTLKALDNGQGAVVAVLLGVLTGVGGGVIRDVLVAEVPVVLRQEIYALAALVGAAAFVALREAEVTKAIAVPASVALVVALRILAMRRNWQAPRPRR